MLGLKYMPNVSVFLSCIEMARMMQRTGEVRLQFESIVCGVNWAASRINLSADYSAAWANSQFATQLALNTEPKKRTTSPGGSVRFCD